MQRKKIHRFLIDAPLPSTDAFSITDDRIVHQIGRVLKMDIGEEIALFSSGSGDTIAQIREITKDSIGVEKVGTRDAIAATRTLIAAVAIPKGDTFELIVQKLTELGVSTIVPLITARTVKQSVRLDRLQAISDEALEQCGGSTRVTITEPKSLKECLNEFPYPSIAFEPEKNGAKEISDNTVVIYIGPEGGWSEEELEILTDKGVSWQSLGERILRTETAAIVAAFSILG